MGRHYSGDIEGKFWFGVQSSDDADFFGGRPNEPEELAYNFVSDDLAHIEEGLEECRKQLGDSKAKLDAFFSDHEGYSDARLAEETGIAEGDIAATLKWYARLELGTLIHACVVRNGACNFTAEL